MSAVSLQAMREIASKFCADRDWYKFHLPASIALALAGNVASVFLLNDDDVNK